LARTGHLDPTVGSFQPNGPVVSVPEMTYWIDVCSLIWMVESPRLDKNMFRLCFQGHGNVCIRGRT